MQDFEKLGLFYLGRMHELERRETAGRDPRDRDRPQKLVALGWLPSRTPA